jgi:group I intron endonuclease
MADPKYHTWRGFRADADNPPLPRPGVYLIRHVASGKAYVGISQNVERRLQRHTTTPGRRIISQALRKHGLGRFEIVPLFYSITGTDCLPAMEAELIRQLGTIAPAGYNVAECDGRAGPYGPAFSAILKAQMAADPRKRARISAHFKALWQDPAHRTRMSAERRSRYADPAERAQHAATIKAAKADPAKRARASERSKAMWADPAERTRQSERMKAMWAERPAELAQHSGLMKAMWAERPAERVRLSERTKAMWDDPAYRARQAERIKAMWADQEYRARHSARLSERNKAMWADPAYRARQTERLKKGRRAKLKPSPL